MSIAMLGHREAFAVGDVAYLEDPRGRAYPMLAQVAMQEASSKLAEHPQYKFYVWVIDSQASYARFSTVFTTPARK